MKRIARRLFTAVLFSCCPFITGCYSKLVYPDLMSSKEAGTPRAVLGAKVSAETIDARNSCCGFRPEPERISDVLKSLLKEHEIEDVLSSSGYDKDRLNIAVFELDAHSSGISKVISAPLSLVSMLTLGIIPSYGRETHPIEIHIINPRAPKTEQLEIVRTEYVTSQWAWLPLLLVKDGPNGKGGFFYTDIFGPKQKKSGGLRELGLTEALRPVISRAVERYEHAK